MNFSRLMSSDQRMKIIYRMKDLIDQIAITICNWDKG